ncbi:glutathione S-transferase family protein [Haliea sp. E17]|uniref:glutathione S-transferase family protein n=1 Tax=Haliea sp. E17 TaxID=3401576 RepID=UPI003AB0FD95
MIELYGNASPNLIKVLFMLGETRLPFEVKYLNLMAGENFDADYLAINPNAKIPAIIDRDGPDGEVVTVFESGAILVYLAEKCGQFYGNTASQRAVVMQWLMLQMSGIGPTFGQAVHFRENGPAPAGSDYPRTRYFTEAARLCDVLDARLAQSENLAGDEFSIADMASFPWLRNYPATLGIDLTGLPHLQRWRAATEAREGFQRIRPTLDAMIARGLEEQKVADPDKLDRFFRRGRWARQPASNPGGPAFGDVKP